MNNVIAFKKPRMQYKMVSGTVNPEIEKIIDDLNASIRRDEETIAEMVARVLHKD